jgi:hypothetical protein
MEINWFGIIIWLTFEVWCITHLPQIWAAFDHIFKWLATF